MARLTEKQKRAVPKSKRGVPSKSGTGSYPLTDKAHARAAVGLYAMHHGGKKAPFAARAAKVMRGGKKAKPKGKK